MQKVRGSSPLISTNTVPTMFKLSKGQKVTLITAIIGSSATLIAARISLSDNAKVSFNNSVLTNSPVVTDSSNISFTYKTVSSIPFDRSYEVSVNDFAAEDGSILAAFLNIKFIFPDGQIAFVPRLTKEKAILAYSNEDCSEIHLTDKYHVLKIEDSEVCWIIDVSCQKNDPGPFQAGPKTEKGPCVEHAN